MSASSTLLETQGHCSSSPWAESHAKRSRVCCCIARMNLNSEEDARERWKRHATNTNINGGYTTLVKTSDLHFSLTFSQQNRETSCLHLPRYPISMHACMYVYAQFVTDAYSCAGGVGAMAGDIVVDYLARTEWYREASPGEKWGPASLIIAVQHCLVSAAYWRNKKMPTKDQSCLVCLVVVTGRNS